MACCDLKLCLPVPKAKVRRGWRWWLPPIGSTCRFPKSGASPMSACAWARACWTPRTAIACGLHFYTASNDVPAFRQTPLADVLSGRSPASRFAGHTVFVGLTARQWITPLATPVSVAMAPVEALAHASSALSQDHVVVQPMWAQGATLLVSAAVGALLMWQLPRLRGGRRFALALAVVCAAADHAMDAADDGRRVGAAGDPGGRAVARRDHAGDVAAPGTGIFAVAGCRAASNAARRNG